MPRKTQETEGRWMNYSPQSQALDLPTVTDLFTFSSFSACICHLLSSPPPLPSSPSAVRKQAAPSPVLPRKSEFTSGQRRRRCCSVLSRTDDSYIHFYLEEKEGTAIWYCQLLCLWSILGKTLWWRSRTQKYWPLDMWPSSSVKDGGRHQTPPLRYFSVGVQDKMVFAELFHIYLRLWNPMWDVMHPTVLWLCGCTIRWLSSHLSLFQKRTTVCPVNVFSGPSLCFPTEMCVLLLKLVIWQSK